MTPKDVVMSNYPHAQCRKINAPGNPYFMIYDMANSMSPILIGYDMESEDRAWEMTSKTVGQRMLDKLEKSADND